MLRDCELDPGRATPSNFMANRENIVARMKWLVEDAQEGDLLFLHCKRSAVPLEYMPYCFEQTQATEPRKTVTLLLRRTG